MVTESCCQASVGTEPNSAPMNLKLRYKLSDIFIKKSVPRTFHPNQKYIMANLDKLGSLSQPEPLKIRQDNRNQQNKLYYWS